MKVEYLSIGEIRPYEHNPRFNDLSVEEVAESIREFGFRQPIVVDSENTIIIGHTRYKAALKLGLKKVPVYVADGLTDAQAKALRIADNRLGELTSWDDALLGDEIRGIVEMGYDVGKTFLDQNVIDSFMSDASDNGDDGGDGDGGSGIDAYPYTLWLKDDDEQDEFFDILVMLREWYPDEETIGKRIVKFISNFASSN